MKSDHPTTDHPRLPPQSIETEESLLCAILIDNKTLLDVIEILSPEDFYKPAHQKIFDAVTDLFRKNEPADLVTVHNILKEKGQLEQAGGAAYLSGLLDTVPVAVNAPYYARIIRDKACLRRLIEKANSITRRCVEDTGNVDEVIDFAERAIFEISENKISPSFYPIGRIIEDNIDALEKRQENKALITGVPTGFSYFDQLTAGLQNSDLIILAARPSQGKTALALNMARNAAVDSGIPVAVFSLEMSKEQLSMRMLCAEARVDSSRVRSGFFSQEDWLRLTDAAGKLSQSPIFIDDSASISDMEIRAKARRLKMNENLGLIIIDYLQLMKGRASAERRDLEIAEISRSLKALAKELDLPVVALSQLNRKLEERGDKRPILSDLRESGCLSGDTRIVLSNGERIAIRDMAEQKQLAEVLSMNEHNLKTEAMKISNAFSTGIHSVYRLETASGRQLKATANHKFRTLAEWKRLDQFKKGEYIAVPRRIESFTDVAMKDCELALLGHLIGDGCTLPRHTIQYTTNEKESADMVAGFASELFPDDISPRIKKERTWYQVYLASSRRLTHNVRNAIAGRLSELDVFGLRSYQKRVPEKVFSQSARSISCFLRHLWATDGSITVGKDQRGYFRHHIYYASSSPELAYDVSSLLLRLGINAVVKKYSQNNKGRDQYQVMITGKSNVENFINNIGAVGRKKDNLEKIKKNLANIKENTNRDVIPKEAWRAYVVPSMAKHGITTREMQAALGNSYCGTSLYKNNISRERAERVALAVKSPILKILSDSDIYWDKIRNIEYSGEEETFDLTVPVHHNFIANDIFAHNSLEQDADVVAFIYRDEVYNKDENNPAKGKAEIIIAKQRNGPIGTVNLSFINKYTRFENPAPEM